MKIKLTSALKPSAPTVALIALRFASAPKRIKRFATDLNARLDLPVLDEGQEQVLLERTLTLGCEAAARALNGSRVLSSVSLRDSTRQALLFLADHVDELNAEYDIPFVPEALETWGAEQLRDFIVEHAVPWVDDAPSLQ